MHKDTIMNVNDFANATMIRNNKNKLNLNEYQQGIVDEASENAAVLGAGMIAKSAARWVPGANIALAVDDISSGYNNERFGGNDWRSRLANTIAGGANGMSIGLIPEEETARGWYNMLGGKKKPMYVPPKMDK